MSVQSEITRLTSAKTDIAAAIAEKGVDVPEGTALDGMAELIGAISTGGSCYVGTVTTTATASSLSIAADFGFVPTTVLVIRSVQATGGNTYFVGVVYDSINSVNTVYMSSSGGGGSSARATITASASAVEIALTSTGGGKAEFSAATYYYALWA